MLGYPGRGYTVLVMQHGKRRSAAHSPGYRYMLKRLRTARLDADMTQVEVAEAGRPQTFVSKVELGERRIDPIELQQFAGLYRKRITYFLPRPGGLR